MKLTTLVIYRPVFVFLILPLFYSYDVVAQVTRSEDGIPCADQFIYYNNNTKREVIQFRNQCAGTISMTLYKGDDILTSYYVPAGRSVQYPLSKKKGRKKKKSHPSVYSDLVVWEYYPEHYFEADFQALNTRIRDVVAGLNLVSAAGEPILDMFDSNIMSECISNDLSTCEGSIVSQREWISGAATDVVTLLVRQGLEELMDRRDGVLNLGRNWSSNSKRYIVIPKVNL